MTRDEFEKMVAADMVVSAQATRGSLKNELDDLLRLSREDIDAILPGATDVETYDKLIAIVRRASAANLSQAEVRARILELGDVGVTIAKKVRGLAGLFI